MVWGEGVESESDERHFERPFDEGFTFVLDNLTWPVVVERGGRNAVTSVVLGKNVDKAIGGAVLAWRNGVLDEGVGDDSELFLLRFGREAVTDTIFFGEVKSLAEERGSGFTSRFASVDERVLGGAWTGEEVGKGGVVEFAEVLVRDSRRLKETLCGARRRRWTRLGEWDGKGEWIEHEKVRFWVEFSQEVRARRKCCPS